jgi:sialic acid synthase SpsE
LGIDTAIYSVVAGARVVEKHFTIDKNYSDFRDHQLSADPDELRTLADKINEVSKILGNNKKEITKSEKEVAALARRSIVASHDILENHILSAQDFDYLRPANGLPPNKLNEIIGRATNRIILKGQLITLDLLN